MKRRGYLLALGLVLVVNGLVLAGVAYNRSGAPTARVVLTERELPVGWAGLGSGEDTGLSLRINWRLPSVALGTQEGAASPSGRWFDASKLAELGFDVDFPRNPGEYRSIKQPLPRRAYVVLEYGGAAWEAFREAKREEIRRQLAKAENDRQRERINKMAENEEKTGSRLFAVDVGRDPAALRARHPDRTRYLVVPAEVAAFVRPRFQGSRLLGYTLEGQIVQLLPDTINVPRRYRALISSRPNGAAGLRYQVTLAYGRRYEAWIESVAPPNQAQ